jgi:hypothetical protein
MDLTILIFLTTTQTQETVLRISDDINPFVKATYAIFSLNLTIDSVNNHSD